MIPGIPDEFSERNASFQQKLAGDPLYGTGTGPGLLKLHACYLSFAHPRTGERLEFNSEPLF
jgi:23S rRNA-/tRNA-specific pseudouridylate synthase